MAQENRKINAGFCFVGKQEGRPEEHYKIGKVLGQGN
jgi:hypothetical protein